jgi:hypothetical protein
LSGENLEVSVVIIAKFANVLIAKAKGCQPMSTKTS